MKHKEENVSKLTVENIPQQIRYKKMVDQVSPGMIGAISISNPPEDNTDTYRDYQLALALQKLEEDEVQNLKEKEQMIMRGG